MAKQSEKVPALSPSPSDALIPEETGPSNVDQDTGVAPEAGESKGQELVEDDSKPQEENETVEDPCTNEAGQEDDPWR